jgi:hypothetical protein
MNTTSGTEVIWGYYLDNLRSWSVSTINYRDLSKQLRWPQVALHINVNSITLIESLKEY